MADGTIKILTELATEGLKKGLKAATGMIAGAAASLAGLGTAAIKVGSDFEAAMSRVNAISGATAEEFEKLNALAKELGASTAFSASEAAAGMENLASAGFGATQIMSAMPGMLDLAAVSGGDVAVAADIAASALNAFGLEASEAGHVADIFAKAAAETNAETLDMGDAMKYVGPVAKSMGQSIEETAAAIGIMSDAGVKGSQAGTALRGALSRLAKPTKVMRGTMDDLNLSFYDADGNMLSLKDQIKKLQVAFEGLSQEERNNALVTLYGQESLSGMLALIEAGPDKLGELTKSLEESDGAAASMAKTMQDNLKGAVEELSGAAETLGIEIYESMQQPLKKLAKEGTSSLNKLTKAFKRGGFTELAKEVGAVISELTTKISKSAPKLVKAATEMIKGLLDGIRDNLPEIMEGAVETVSAFISGIVDTFPDMVDTGMAMLSELLKGFAQALPELIPRAVKGLTGTITSVLTNLDELFNAGVEIVKGLVNGIINAVPQLVDGLGYAIRSMFGAVTEQEKDLREAIERVSAKNEELAESLANVSQEFNGQKTSINNTYMAVQPLLDRLGELEEKTRLTADEQEEWNDILSKVKEQIPEVSGLIDEQTGFIKGGTTALEKAAEAWKYYAKAEAYATVYKSALEKVAEAEANLASAQSSYYEATSSYGLAAAQFQILADAFAEAGYKGITSVEGLYAAMNNDISLLKYGEQVDSISHLLNGFGVATWDIVPATDAVGGKIGELRDEMTEAQSVLDEATAAADRYKLGMENCEAEAKRLEAEQAELSETFRLHTGKTVKSSEEYIEAVQSMYGTTKNSTLEMALEWAKSGKEIDGITKDTVSDMLRNFSNLPEDMQNAGKEALLGLLGGMEDEIPGLENVSEMSADEIVAAIKTALDIHSPSRVMATLGAQTMAGMSDGILGAVAALVAAMRTVGIQLCAGMREGMQSQISSLVSTAKDIANRVTKAFKANLEIHSPSRRLAREIGKPAAQGIGVGFEDAMKGVLKKMERAINIGVAAVPSGALRSASGLSYSAAGAGPSVTYAITNNVESPVPITVAESAKAANRATEDSLFKLGVYGR